MSYMVLIKQRELCWHKGLSYKPASCKGLLTSAVEANKGPVSIWGNMVLEEMKISYPVNNPSDLTHQQVVYQVRWLLMNWLLSNKLLIKLNFWCHEQTHFMKWYVFGHGNMCMYVSASVYMGQKSSQNISVILTAPTPVSYRKLSHR